MIKHGGEMMTKEEIQERYGIPKTVLDEYHKMGLCHSVQDVMEAWQYDDEDIERLSMIMALHDVGFDKSEVEYWLQSMINDSHSVAGIIKMINEKRKQALNEIHFQEKRLERLDYLKHNIKK